MFYISRFVKPMSAAVLLGCGVESCGVEVLAFPDAVYSGMGDNQKSHVILW